jgi:ABC-type uncharacterized transport system YnjBCD permease subunit
MCVCVCRCELVDLMFLAAKKLWEKKETKTIKMCAILQKKTIKITYIVFLPRLIEAELLSQIVANELIVEVG